MADRKKPPIYGSLREEDIFQSLNTLEVFPDLPLPDHVTVCEINTEIQVAFSPDSEHPPGARAFTSLTDRYIPVTEESLKPRVSSKRIPTIRGGSIEEDGILIKPEQENFVKAAWDGWNDDGLEGMLKELRRSNGPTAITNTVLTILSWRKSISRFWPCWRCVEVYFYPHLALPPGDLIQNFAPVRQWKRSWVKAISWHPTYSAFALALNDDTIRVVAHEEDVISLLRYYDQQMVTCLAWRPFSAELAVGVEAGLLIWHVRGSVTSSSSRAKLHRLPGHCPITSLDYNANGRRLLTSSANDNCLVVWNTDSWKPTPLTRIFSGGIPRAMWSNSSNPSVFCTTPASLFLIWTFDNGVRSRKWNTATKYVEAFAWSPCGTSVIFVNDFILYTLDLRPSEIELVSEKPEPIVTPLFNLRVCTVPQTGSNLRYKAGGNVLHIDWDPTGNRLAVLFSDSELVATFRVQRRPSITLIPSGYIRGQDGELPVTIAFQKNFKHGAMLLIAWSSRRVQYFPMVFAEPSAQTNLVTQEPSYYINHRVQNLTSMSGLASESSKIPVDFGPCFSQPQPNVTEGSQRLQSPSTLESPSHSTGPKLFSMSK